MSLFNTGILLGTEEEKMERLDGLTEGSKVCIKEEVISDMTAVLALALMERLSNGLPTNEIALDLLIKASNSLVESTDVKNKTVNGGV